jgi:nucleoid-associated protein Lsr2
VPIGTVLVTLRGQEAGVATRITVLLEDDLDGGPADETVRFGLDGVDYEIDLSRQHARAFRREFASFLIHARRAERGRRRRPARGSSGRRSNGDIRAWAKDAGIEVSDRGRIPASVVAQYQAATGGP